MTKLYLTLQPQESGKTFTYNYGNVIINITLDKSQKVSDTYAILLYNEQLMLFAVASTIDAEVTRRGKAITFTSLFRHIWLPGNYFLLLRNSSGTVWRFDIRLDDKATFHCESPSVCLPMSDEDMLSGPLYDACSTWRNLSIRPGTMQLKRWVLERAKRNAVNKRRCNEGMGKLSLNSNLILCHSRRHSFMPETIMLLHAADIDTRRMFGHCASFYDMTRNAPYEALRDFFDKDESGDDAYDTLSSLFSKGKDRTYVFSELSALTENGGRLIVNKILNNWPDEQTSAVFRGTQQEIDALLEMYPTIGEHIPAENRLSIVPYTCEEMICAFFLSIASAKLCLSPEATDKACRMFCDAYHRGIITHWLKADIDDYIKTHLMASYQQRLIHASETGERGLEVQPSDIDEAFFLNQSNAYNEALRELHAMVGLKEIKQNIATLSGRTKFFQMRRQMGLHCSDDATFHTILTGNPGTGKTTVAKLLGKIYHSLGLLSKGDVVFVDRTKIVGRYIGETEENMKQILKEAQGNVLFIDEAYTLYSKDDERDFGRHAIESLLDVLARKNPDMLIVFAGYEKEMDALLSMNQGLEGRFPYRFRFPDYTADELMQIAERLLQKDEYELTPEASALLLQTIRQAVHDHSLQAPGSGRADSFAGARWIEQFVSNGIITAFADRITSSPHIHVTGKAAYQRIEAADVRAAAERFCNRNAAMKRRAAIGFCA